MPSSINLLQSQTYSNLPDAFVSFKAERFGESFFPRLVPVYRDGSWKRGPHAVSLDIWVIKLTVWDQQHQWTGSHHQPIAGMLNSLLSFSPMMNSHGLKWKQILLYTEETIKLLTCKKLVVHLKVRPYKYFLSYIAIVTRN